MKDKKRKITITVIISFVAVVFIVFGTLACLGVFREFNAYGYVSAILDQTLKGEVKEAAQMMDGTTEEALYTKYEAGVEGFVKNTLLSGREIDAELEDKYVDLCKKIFAKMDYQVGEAEKVTDDEFKVPVYYRPSNVLQLFVTSVDEEIQKINEKKEKGEDYRGTQEEIFSKMEAELSNNLYKALGDAYENMEFGKEQTMIIEVRKGADELYALDETAITEFLVKILGLDEKQD